VSAPTAVPTGNTYDKYGSGNPIERRLMAGFMDRLDASLPAEAPATILEVGVGEGEVADRVAQRFPDAFVTGIDLPDESLAEHWSSRRLAASFADIVALPYPDDTFDLVLAIEVLEHVPNPMAALRELARVARGDLVLSVPREPLWRVANMARGKYWRDLGNTPGHIQHWGRGGFTRLVGAHLDVVDVHSPTPWTMVAARVRG
jgi:2-polyprenyl-3-methyl-5-hydroxy-6-metoxy-1,4-benzoquinol methylase